MANQRQFAWVSETALKQRIMDNKKFPANIWRLVDGREVLASGVSDYANIADIRFADKKILGEVAQWLRAATFDETLQYIKINKIEGPS